MEFETKIIELINRTYNVKSFRFERPNGFTYKPGQYLLLSVRADGKELQKPLSISSSPTETGFLECTKKLTGHDFSNALDALKIGDQIKVNAPFGNFTFEGEYDKIALLSGGIGITPLRSVCKYCTDKKLKTKITLLYGNETERDIVFIDQFEEMQKLNKNFRAVYTVSKPSPSWKGLVGYITKEMIRDEVADFDKTVYCICGPPKMLEAMENQLKGLNVPQSNIREEQFLGY